MRNFKQKLDMQIKTAQTKEDFLKCFDAMQALRPHLTHQLFLDLMQKMQAENYTLIYIEEENKVISACGFRYLTTLFDGRYIYIDDLSTLPEARGKGHAGMLFDFVVEKAKSENLKAVHLDSGHQRFDAHRLYLNKGMKIVNHHFKLEL
jgi:GNAT superfamily N-acetyltransferase